MTATKEEIEATRRRLIAKKANANGVLTKEDVDAISQDLSKVLGAIKDENPISINTLNELFPYLAELVPLLKDKAFDGCYEFRLAKIFVDGMKAFAANESVQERILVFVSILRGNIKFLDYFLKNDGGPALKAVLKEHGKNPDSRIVNWVLFIVMWVAYKNFDSIISFVDDSIVDLLIRILSETSQEKTMAYTVEILILLTKNQLTMNDLPKKFAETLTKVAGKWSHKHCLLITRAIASLVDLIHGKKDAKIIIASTGLIQTIELLCTNKESCVYYVSIMYFLHLAGVTINIAGKENIFLDVFTSGKCFEKTKSFCFANIKPDVNTLRTIVEKCGDSFYELFQKKSSGDIYNKFSSVLFLSDEEFLRSGALNYQKVSEILDNTLAKYGQSAEVLSRVFSTKLLDNSKITFNGKTVMTNLQAAKNDVFLCYCKVLERLLEKSPESIVPDFVTENGLGVFFNKEASISRDAKCSIVKGVAGYLDAASKKNDPGIKGLLELIEKNDLAHLLSGAKEKIPGIFALIRIMAEHKKENFKICDELVLDLVLRELRDPAGDSEIALECGKALKVLVSVVPMTKSLVDEIGSLCSAFKEKNPPLCAELGEALRCLNGLNLPCSLFMCKSGDEVKALLSKMSIRSNADLNTLVSYIKGKQNNDLAMRSMDVLVRNKKVFCTYDKSVDYNFLIRSFVYYGNESTDDACVKNSNELLEYIFRASLHSNDKEYFSEICNHVFNNNKNPDYVFHTPKRSENVLFIFDNRTLIEKFKNSALSTGEKKELVKVLANKKDVLPFFDPGELVAFLMPMAKESSEDLDTLKPCVHLFRKLIEELPHDLVNFQPNDFVSPKVVNSTKWDRSLQEDRIKIIKRSGNIASLNNASIVAFVDFLMRSYREDVSIQEDVSLVLKKVHTDPGKRGPWERSDVIYDAVVLLGVNPYNVLISENVLDFLCNLGIIKFIKNCADINIYLVRIVTDFLCDENIFSSSLKEKAVLVLHGMLKSRKGLLSDELYSVIATCAKKMFFAYGNGVKAHFAKIVAGEKQREGKFVNEIYTHMREKSMRQPDVWRILSKYTSYAEEFNLRERGAEIGKVFEVLESYQKPDGAEKPNAERVFQIMKDERGCQRIALEALKVLKLMYENNKNENLVIKCLKRVKKIMVLYYGNTDIQRIGYEVMSVYAEKSQFRNTIQNGYYKELLIDNLRNLSSYVDTQQRILSIVKSVINMGYDHFMKSDNIEVFAALINKLKGMPEEDSIRKQILADGTCILKSAALIKKVQVDVLPDILECLKDLHDLGSFDDKMGVLATVGCLSKDSDFHYAIIKGGWLEFIMKDFKKKSAPSMVDGVISILCNLLPVGYKIDEGSDNSNEDDVNMLSQEESSNDVNDKFVKEAVVGFVNRIDLNEYKEIIKDRLSIDVKTLFSGANKLLGLLLRYPSVKARIGDFAWLHYCVESLNVIIESGKFANQKKDLSTSCSRLWEFDVSAIDVAFFESGLSMNDPNVRESVIPAIGSLLAHENANTENLRMLKQVVLKAREEFKDSGMIQAYSAAILGHEDKKVACALKHGVCTRIAVPGCDDSGCQGKQGLYCEKCCVPQDLYMCKKCADGKLLCAHCKEAYHKDHEVVRVLCVGVCQSERGVEDGAEKRAAVQKAIEAMENDAKRNVAAIIKSAPAPKKKVPKSGEKDDEPKEPEKKRRRTNPVKRGCILSRLLDDLVSKNVSVGNDEVKRDCERVDLSSVTLRSAFEKANVKGVDEVCALCSESSNAAYSAYAYCEPTTPLHAAAICALQLTLSSVRKASPENDMTPCEILHRALLEKRRDRVDEVKELFALVLSALGTLKAKSFPVLFHAIPLDSPLLEPFGESAGGSLCEDRRKKASMADRNDQDLSLLTFAATEMSTITSIGGFNPDKYAVVVLVGDIKGYDITRFSSEKTRYLDVVLVPDSKIRVMDVAKSANGFTLVTAQVTCPNVVVKDSK